MWGELTSFKEVRTKKRPPQEPRQARAGMSGFEAAAPVAGRSPAARAARGGTEGRRGYQKRKARAKPEPLEGPRSSRPQRVSAVRGKMRQRSSPEGPRPFRGSVERTADACPSAARAAARGAQ